MDKRQKPSARNTSGFVGVSWQKGARKWEAHIAVAGVRHYLGLFNSAKAASLAREKVAAKLRPNKPKKSVVVIQKELLAEVESLYRQHGIKAVSTPYLEKRHHSLYARLLNAGLKQPTLLKKLGLEQEYTEWRTNYRTYRGDTKPKWSWNSAVAKAKELVEKQGDLPTVEWCRRNGLSALTSIVHNSGRTWEDLRAAIGLKASATFYQSRNNMRWRSRPEASLSNFLYARGIEHKRGEEYDEGYSRQSGRWRGQFDMHFRSVSRTWIDVEVWGDPLNKLSGGRYAKTRKLKEKWNAGNPHFLGIPYKDCLSDFKLTAILEPYIGVIEPFQFDKPTDPFIETSHWSDADDLLDTCKKLAATMPDGIFPSESWLRQRGKHSKRPGQNYNTLAIRVNQWLGGTRNVRNLLGHSHASTTKWTPELIKSLWREFEKRVGLTPSQCKSNSRRASLSADVLAEASKIYGAAQRFNLLKEVRDGKYARKIKWTTESTLAAWNDFVKKHGRTPSSCMSAAQRKRLPRSVTDEATNIYGAASRLGILAQARALYS